MTSIVNPPREASTATTAPSVCVDKTGTLTRSELDRKDKRKALRSGLESGIMKPAQTARAE